uniref:Uncharacterized protein n=1 Tax=Lutzomyia longipalpis TaxID=7200 RepID=A0A1B0EV99_LUTLO
MMRLSLEMFSNTANESYKEVASVSFHGDYLRIHREYHTLPSGFTEIEGDLSRKAMLLKRINTYSWQQLRKYSALYLTGDKAREEYASVHPFLDFKGILGDRKGLQENLAKRKSQINLSKLYEQWDKYRKLQEEKSTLEKKRIDIAENLKNQALREEEIERLKAEGKALRNTLKDLKENSYNFEEEFINKSSKSQWNSSSYAGRDNL